MPHDPLFEQRIVEALRAQDAKAEPRKMFGGVAFMVSGNMCVGITNKGDLMVRFSAEQHTEISQWPGAKPMTYGKGGMMGFLFVDAPAVGTNASLAKWVRLSLEYVKTLPKKPTGSKMAKATKAAGNATRSASLNDAASKARKK